MYNSGVGCDNGGGCRCVGVENIGKLYFLLNFFVNLKLLLKRCIKQMFGESMHRWFYVVIATSILKKYLQFYFVAAQVEI